MKKIFITGMVAVTCLSFSPDMMADTTVILPPDANLTTLKVTHVPLSAMLQATRPNDFTILSDEYEVKGNTVTFKLDEVGPARYNIELDQNIGADFYASPDDNLLVQISSLSPVSYTVTGTPLMEGLTEIDSQIKPIEEEVDILMSTGGSSPESMQKLIEMYNGVLKDYIKNNPDSPAVIYALLNLEGEDFINAYDNLSASARLSLLYPFAEKQAPSVRATVEKEKFQRQLASGDKEAPNFSFRNTNGELVSLSDFRGKWVVIDFWGSWCPWCIKGFPSLKEAYKKYAGKLEIVGVACRDTEEAWLNAVKKYELPWVNLLNPAQNGGELVQEYGIQGFPTKAIVNPEGKLVDITTGEDPTFYTRLAEFMNF